MSQGAWCGAIVVAAGGSSRMGGVDKQFALLAGLPVLARTVAAFEAAPEVHAIVVVANVTTLDRVQALGAQSAWSKVVAVVPGGARRQDSADHGLAALEAAAAAQRADLDLVLVHDGARPLVAPDLITRGIAAARQHGAAIAAVPARDTIKVVEADGRITATPDRATLRQAQTPQVFRYALLAAAYQAARTQDLAVTDDAALLEALGIPVYTFDGDPRNLKITTPEDLLVAATLL
ncbi:MAG TPA: 2-C-methyl-D-erythritol 4-phosphate cytidylyltransferase [Chloroflexia bacterium]|nr:2-C-methyl-D-erythritol 4-phosphate cytidylyltransferase [Chloroflexia bacterium]